MTDDPLASVQPSLPSPMTVGRYVRENFRPIASKFMWWAIIAAPVSIAVRARGSHFSMLERFGMVLLTWMIAAVAITVIVSVCLSIAGWWKLHTKISPYVPVTIALIATMAILAYRVS